MTTDPWQPGEELFDECAELILTAVDNEPQYFDDLLDGIATDTDLPDLAEELWTSPEDLLDQLIFRHPRLINLPISDKVTLTDTLLVPLVFTHRLTQEERISQRLALQPDLALVGSFLGRTNAQDRGVFVDEADPHGETLVGPDGWLAGFEPGDLIAVHINDSHIVYEPCEAPGEGTAEATVLGSLVRSVDAPRPMVDYLLEVRTSDPALFSEPVNPLSDLLDDAGLVVHHSLLYDKKAAEHLTIHGDVDDVSEVADLWGFEQCCQDAYTEALEAWSAYVHEADIDVLVADRSLAHGEVAATFLEVRLSIPDATMIADFATLLVESSPRRSVGGRLLRALTLGMVDASLSLEDLEAAHLIDPDNEAVAYELALLLSDAGKAERALNILGNIGHTDTAIYFTLERVARPHAGTPRNAPCPCGSGRKFKQCCFQNPKLSDSVRVGWVANKLANFAVRPQNRYGLIPLAAVAANYDVERMPEMLDDGFLNFVALFEGGLVGSFIDSRGSLLPEGEGDMILEWSERHPNIWVVFDVDPGATVSLRSLQTGEEHIVEERAGSRETQVGQHVLTRVVPAYGAYWLLGGVLNVPEQLVDYVLSHLGPATIDADYARAYGELFRVPEMRTRENEQFIDGEIHLRIHDHEALVAVMDEEYGPCEEGLWRDTLALDEDQTILRATLQIEDEELVLFANSNERLDRVLMALPPMEVTFEERTPIQDPVSAQQYMATRSVPGPEMSPEEAESARAEILDRMETKWLDEEVPALDGLTPREALQDPESRQALEDLLDDFETKDIPGQSFSAASLRRKLGME